MTDEGALIPRRNPDLLAHERAERLLLDSYNSGRLHHAWLIGGPPGIGKATLAYRFARFVLANGGPGEAADGLFGAPPPPSSLRVDPEHPVARRISASGHADLLTIERTWDEKKKRFKRDLPVDEVRRIAPFLRLTSAEGGWRVVVVDGVDQMNPSGQNAILKILEEPPPRALLLLVADNVGALLPTIRSRTRRLMLDPLPEAVVVQLLATHAPDLPAADRTALARLSEGSVGRALDLAQSGGLGLYREILGVLEGLPRLDVLACHGLADKVARAGADQAWEAATELVLWWLARVNRGLARGAHPPEVVAGEGVLAARLAKAAAARDRGLDRWVEVWDNVTRLFARAESANLDRKQTMLSALLAIEAAAA
ncbi:MAG TPA: DNA polymerase III subunit delta' [Azospirillaceae bacterium]|nr:DNA polymerase III subunit delta' [Azospirillaceae bacterium]